jgi:hypothetical protein
MIIIQHGDARIDGQGESFYARGMKAGVEAAKLTPGWDDGTLAERSAFKATVFMMQSEDGAVAYMRGFEKGYRAKR